MKELTWIDVIGIIAAVVLPFLALYWILLNSKLKDFNNKLTSLKMTCEGRQQYDPISIHVISPKDHKPKDPVRESGKPYTIPNISGNARGNIKSAYIFYKHLPSDDPRVIAKLIK